MDDQQFGTPDGYSSYINADGEILAWGNERHRTADVCQAGSGEWCSGAALSHTRIYGRRAGACAIGARDGV